MVRFIILALLIFTAAAGGLFARRIYLERTPPAGVAEYFVGGHKLMIDRAMVRNPEIREGGAFNRLDLALRWRDFRGAAGSSGKSEEGDTFFVALEDAAPRQAATGDIDPADRAGELYARFLDKDAWSNPGGLVMRRFRAGTPYEGEELYISTPDERMFSARCPNSSSGAKLDDLCLWQTRINGLELQVRFAPRYLVEWERLSTGVRALIEKLARPAVPSATKG